MDAYPTISVPKLHLEYLTWMNELNFYKEEIKIFESHLEKVICKNSQHEVTAQVEHFQNGFIRQKEVIDHLKHDLHISEKHLTAFVRKMSGMGLSSIKMDNHTKLREQMQIFRNIYIDLKNSFRKFETQYI
jgi:hypothetical protein